MKKTRTIFIWDVQWCYDELKLLLNKLGLWAEDKVYFVWDLINKWPKSYKVLKYVYKNRDRFKCVVWNQEINFLRWLEWEPYDNPKDFKQLKLKIEKKEANYLIDYLKSLPKFIEEKDFLLLHWWLIPWKKLEDHDIEEITRTRDIDWKPWYDFYTWNKKIIYWHWAVDWLRITKNTVWLDSWCVYWKAMTAYILETWEIYQQSANDIYLNVYKRHKYLESIVNKIESSNIVLPKIIKEAINKKKWLDD